MTKMFGLVGIVVLVGCGILKLEIPTLIFLIKITF